jgi:predicted anti-sigma-YlaC factor YlaD
MNCEKCQELLSDYLDDALSDADRASFGAHLEECLQCFHAHGELNSIVSFCRETRGQYDAPPNESAMWLRIRNTIESQQSLATAATAQNSTRRTKRESWLKSAFGRSWQLSFAQMVTAVVGIVVFASLATVVGLRGLKSTESSVRDINNTGAAPLALTGDRNFQPNDKIILQQQEMKYLIQVVDQRKAHWNPQVRQDFERNLTLLDQTVKESLQRLTEHPHDEVTEEMLNSALNDKMQLLQEFSDL